MARTKVAPQARYPTSEEMEVEVTFTNNVVSLVP